MLSAERLKLFSSLENKFSWHENIFSKFEKLFSSLENSLWCCFFTLLYISLPAVSAGAGETIVFKKYMAADGLSDNAVLCGLRDSYGFMWLGTNNGLNCFDGAQNTVYRNMVENDVASYENNIITAVFEYKGDIWLGGSFGLYIYDRQTNTFHQFSSRTRYGVNISSTVQRIVQAPGGLIWIATLGQGFFTYDPTTDRLTQDSRHGSFFSDILTANGFVFLASLQGYVVAFSDAGNYISQYAIPDYVSDKNSICLEHVGNDLYVGCDRGLYSIHPGQQTIEPIPTALGQVPIRSISVQGNNRLLLGTDQGIYSLQLDTRQLSRFDNPSDYLGRLSDPMVNHLMWDADSTLWVMTQRGGVCYMPTPKSPVKSVSINNHETGRNQMLHSFCEMPDGRLWAGSDNGLLVYDPQTQLFTDAQPAIPQEINVLMPDGDDLWIGTRHDGIYVLNTQNRQLRHYQYSASKPYTVTSNEINALLRTSQGDIYVGTSWSLCRFDRKTENFMWFAEIGSMTNVTSLTEDTAGCVWAASSNHGLFRQTSPRAGFRNYLYSSKQPGTITSNYVTTVYADREGSVWVATNGNGLSRYDARTDGFERFGNPGSILQEQQTYFIIEDQHDNLWVGLENSMAKIDPLRNPANTQILMSTDNLMREQKPHNSALMTRQGEIYAGRNGMLVHFKPEKTMVSNQQMPVYITSVTLPYSTDSDQPASPNLYTGGALTLPFADNSFTLHFSSPRFSGDADVRYEYMLSGVDQTWARGTRNAEATHAALNESGGSEDTALDASENVKGGKEAGQQKHFSGAAGIICLVDKIFFLLGIALYRVGFWGTIFCQQICLGMLTIFGPIQWAFCLLPKWEGAWAKWIVRYLTVHFYGAMLYFVGFYVLLMYDIVFSIQIDQLSWIIADDGANIASYIKVAFFTCIYMLVAGTVSWKCLNLVPDLAAWMIPEGDTAYATRGFGEGIAGEVKRTARI